MYANGWRKYSQKEIFGRYINSSGLSRFMKEKGFDVNQEETQYKKIVDIDRFYSYIGGKWIFGWGGI
ncbi:hypothetical protein PPACK8108_LOCUS8971 [Phakopsora pachyrhizi]|uniref:Uncharacterized protein n=1 Tax=Phakopsora pachyrhizi TaxID=170000 RepID=A0AAV0AY34_PHAPC|nr:hypothetical protein PPACK8108_LOCUS8971 [Phakopsora pachyrhizi]